MEGAGLLRGRGAGRGGRCLRVSGWAVEGDTGDEALRASGCAAVGGQVLGRGALWHGPPWELSPREPRQDLPVPPIHGLSPHGALSGVLRARAQVAGCLRSSHQGRGWPMLGQVGWGQTEGRDGEEG